MKALRALRVAAFLMALATAPAWAETTRPAPKSLPPPPQLEAYIVEPIGWEELRCSSYDPDTCIDDDPTLRARYRVVEAIHGPGWAGERVFELAGDVADYGVETTRTLLVLRTPSQVVAAVAIDEVVGGGWAFCGEPLGFKKHDLALVQPIEFEGVFGDVRRLSDYGRESYSDEYALEGDAVRCRRGVPAGALLRWIEAGGRP